MSYSIFFPPQNIQHSNYKSINILSLQSDCFILFCLFVLEFHDQNLYLVVVVKMESIPYQQFDKKYSVFSHSLRGSMVVFSFYQNSVSCLKDQYFLILTLLSSIKRYCILICISLIALDMNTLKNFSFINFFLF